MSGGIGSDISSSLGLLGGGVMSLMGMPQVGLPMMLGGTSSLLGGNGPAGGGGLAGFADPLGGALGSAMSGGPAAISAPPVSPPAMSAPSSMAAMSAPPAPAMLSPTGTGATPMTAATLSPQGGGPAPAATGQLTMGDASGVGGSYLNYLQQLNLQKYRPTYAAAHNSAVGAPTFNPLAPTQSSPIAPPQLTV